MFLKVSLRRAAVAIVAFAACGTPTGLCGCPPARTSIVLLGRLVDGKSVLVPNAQVTVHASRQSGPIDLLIISNHEYSTDSLGEFEGLVYSAESPGALWLRMVVRIAGSTSPFEVQGGEAWFKYTPDTVRMSFQIP